MVVVVEYSRITLVLAVRNEPPPHLILRLLPQGSGPWWRRRNGRMLRRTLDEMEQAVPAVLMVLHSASIAILVSHLLSPCPRRLNHRDATNP